MENHIDKVAEQIETKSKEEILAGIIEILNFIDDRDAYAYYRVLIEGTFEHYMPGKYQLYNRRENKGVDYKSEAIRLLSSIADERYFRKIYSFIKGLLS